MLTCVHMHIGAYWRVIEEYGVNSFFTAPTAARAIQREDPDGKLASSYDLSSLAAVHMAGERLDPSRCDTIIHV